MGRARPRLRKALIVVATSYLSLEAAMYVAASAGCRSYGVYVPPEAREGAVIHGTYATYDPYAGYKWKPGRARFSRVSAGEVLFDAQVYFNNFGYRANRDFATAKPAGTRRFVVLGDSFTAGLYLETPWPDRLAGELARGTPLEPLEVYNFAVDGSGLPNWHSIFFHEIVPHFDLDGVILAPFGDDLRRNFIAMTRREDALYFTPVSAPPPATETELLAAYGDRMKRVIAVSETEVVEETPRAPRFQALGPTFYFARYLRANQVRLTKWVRETRRRRAGLPLVPDRRSRPELTAYLESQLGADRARMLIEILDHCRLHSLAVVIASIPGYDALLARNERGVNAPDQLELKQIADTFGVDYFDGYEPFLGLGAEDLRGHWLKGDAHWNQRGADRFARALAVYLRDDWRGFPR